MQVLRSSYLSKSQSQKENINFCAVKFSNMIKDSQELSFAAFLNFYFQTSLQWLQYMTSFHILMHPKVVLKVFLILKNHTNFKLFYGKEGKYLYLSILFRYDCPSCPPTAYKRSFRTATPTPHRLLLIGATSRHSLLPGSYFSTLEMASPLHQPPTAGRQMGITDIQDWVMSHHQITKTITKETNKWTATKEWQTKNAL